MSIGEHRHCCVTFEKYKDLYGKKPIVSVTYENERISIKKQLTLLKMCVTSLLFGPRADLWPFYGFLRKRFFLYIKVYQCWALQRSDLSRLKPSTEPWLKLCVTVERKRRGLRLKLPTLGVGDSLLLPLTSISICLYSPMLIFRA